MRDLPAAFPAAGDAWWNLPGTFPAAGNALLKLPVVLPAVGKVSRNHHASLPAVGNPSRDLRVAFPMVGNACDLGPRAIQCLPEPSESKFHGAGGADGHHPGAGTELRRQEVEELISRLEAYRYRCFSKLAVELGTYNVVAGPNGSGKTTLLDLPALLGDLLAQRVVSDAFLESQPSRGVPRAHTLSELIHRERGDDLVFAVEARLPEELTRALVATSSEAVRSAPGRWPTHLRYEVCLRLLSKLELHVAGEYLLLFPEGACPALGGGIQGAPEANQHGRRRLRMRRPEWRSVIRRNGGDASEFFEETVARPRSVPRQVPPTQLALANLPFDRTMSPAAFWLRELLQEKVVLYGPDSRELRRASPPGQPMRVLPTGRNLPWLALRLQEGDPERFHDWVEHVQAHYAKLAGIEVGEYAPLTDRIEKIVGEKPRTAAEIRDALGKKAPGGTGLSAILGRMGREGRIVRAGVRGGARSQSYEYARMADWIDLPAERPSRAEALRALAPLWLNANGPATVADFAWWAGVSQRDARAALTAIGCRPVAVNGLEGELQATEELLDDLAPTPAADDEVDLVPLWDSYLMAHRDRRRYLDDALQPYVVDRIGNVTNVVLRAGRAVGVWDLNGATLLYALFEKVPRRALEAAAKRLAPLHEIESLAPVVDPPPLAAGGRNAFLAPLRACATND